MSATLDGKVKLTAIVDAEVAKKIKVLAVVADVPLCDYLACLCESAIANNTDENGNLIIDEDDEY